MLKVLTRQYFLVRAGFCNQAAKDKIINSLKRNNEVFYVKHAACVGTAVQGKIPKRLDARL